MHWADILVLLGYFALMIVIGVVTSRRIKQTEDYFLGGRNFGKLLQTFAAFGAGTGSSDPVNVGKTVFISGMSGMWSVMYWLFVTPFYWITGTWYRRMRHLTLGDWFVERYQSKALGAAYTLFGLLFMIVYGSMLFSAIGKVAAPLVGTDTFEFAGRLWEIEYLLVPVIGVVVLAYGIAGGLEAAYFTDLVQGLCIIVLSVMLIPFGLQALVEKFGDPSTQGMLDGFRIMHEQIPESYFSVVGSNSASEFPVHRILAVVIINLAGVVIQPHFIATGGGSAKTEMTARVGLVAGNFLKRFCTVGWVLTALIALALYSDLETLIEDPEKTWGLASKTLLGPGLSGLMLACLLAALMSSIDAYMVVGSALMVRNLYVPYINPQATEKQCLRLGRLTGLIVVGGSVLVSLFIMDVFAQLQLTWIVPLMFAPVFWVGMYWRRATLAAAWCTVISFLLVFMVMPPLIPLVFPSLRENPAYLETNDLIETVSQRPSAPSDVARRQTQIAQWKIRQQALQEKIQGLLQELRQARGGAQAAADLREAEAALAALGTEPGPLGATITEVVKTGGKAIFWAGGAQPVAPSSDMFVQDETQLASRGDETDRVTRMRYRDDVQLRGVGSFQVEFLLYHWAGLDMSRMSNATLSTLELPPKLLAPFLLMIVISLFTPATDKRALDRYYAKMKTPVIADPARDRQALEEAYANPQAVERKKIFPGSSLEMQKPTVLDVVGFLVCFVTCFLIIGLALWIGRIGA